MPRKTGRPTKLTPATREAILTNLASGCTYEVAAEAAGINRSTFLSWRKRGEDGEEPFATFLADVQRAEAECERNMLTRIRVAAREPRHWTAAAWYLERRRPERWRKRETIEHAGRVDQGLDLSGLTDEELATLDAVFETAEARKAEAA